MKNKSIKLWLLLTALFSCMTINADKFKDGEFYFRTLGYNSLRVETTYCAMGEYGNNYVSGDIKIPRYAKYKYTVTNIGSRTFHHCYITSVYIPETITFIEDDAFQECKTLNEITVDSLNRKYCSYNGILYSKDKSEIVRCPEGYKSTLVEIPNSVTSIGPRAFERCSQLTSVSIPNSVTSIGPRAFYLCPGPTSVYIPNSVTSIGTWAFCGCGLTSVYIPSSVTSIGNEAFRGCENLKYIYCMFTTPIECDPFTDVIDNIYMNATLYVPVGTINEYKKVYPWCNFQNIEEFDYSGVDDITIDGNLIVQIQNGEIIISGIADTVSVEIFDISGKTVYKGYDRTIGNLAKGIYIIKTDNIIKKIQL